MGRSGLERLRFGVYLLVPVLAVGIYSLPVVHENALKSARYVVYPADQGAALREQLGLSAAGGGGAGGERKIDRRRQPTAQVPADIK